MPEEDLVSLMKNLPDSSQISAWERETTFDLKASLFEERRLAALSPIPDLSVNLPMRSGGSSSLISRVMGSKRRVRRESRWGTRRMRWVWPGEEEAEDGPRWSWGGTGRGIGGGVVARLGSVGSVSSMTGVFAFEGGCPVERLRLRMLEMPSEAATGVCGFPFGASWGMMRPVGAKDLRRFAREVGWGRGMGRGVVGGDGDESRRVVGGG